VLFILFFLHPFTTEIKREIKISTLKTVSDDYESISKESVVEISWWLENIKSVNGKDIRPKHVDMWIETDASTQGWGCKFNDKYAGGRWSEIEPRHHIFFLELLAIFYSLKAFFTDSHSLHVGIKSDNITAVAYINDMGGMCSVFFR
jgi:hypothetical protein